MRLEYFELIDRVVAVDVAKQTIRTEGEVPLTSPIFEGHFPGYPLMPGVLLIESMAQTAGWLVLVLQKFERMPFLAAVKQAKLRKFVTPGERLVFDGSLIHDGYGFSVVQVSASTGGRSTCDAEIMLRLVPFPNKMFERELRRTAERLAVPLEFAPDG